MSSLSEFHSRGVVERKVEEEVFFGLIGPLFYDGFDHASNYRLVGDKDALGRSSRLCCLSHELRRVDLG